MFLQPDIKRYFRVHVSLPFSYVVFFFGIIFLFWSFYFCSCFPFVLFTPRKWTVHGQRMWSFLSARRCLSKSWDFPEKHSKFGIIGQCLTFSIDISIWNNTKTKNFPKELINFSCRSCPIVVFVLLQHCGSIKCNLVQAPYRLNLNNFSRVHSMWSTSKYIYRINLNFIPS